MKFSLINRLGYAPVGLKGDHWLTIRRDKIKSLTLKCVSKEHYAIDFGMCGEYEHLTFRVSFKTYGGALIYQRSKRMYKHIPFVNECEVQLYHTSFSPEGILESVRI